MSSTNHDVHTMYEEAVNHPTYGEEWRRAIQSELESMDKNHAWDMVKPPSGVNIVDSKWIFAIKRDANNEIVRFKARLVARGFSQAYGVDFWDTFAPVAKLTTYRLIFALATLEQWELHGVDITTAFLLGELEEDIYMALPPGYRWGKGLVCKLKKSIYGLKQAAHIWNRKLHDFLVKLGFNQLKADPFLYVYQGRPFYLTIWVDDILIAGPKPTEIA